MESSAHDALSARAQERASWVHARLRERIATYRDAADFRLSALWPALVDWCETPAPDAGDGRDDLALEVSFQTGDDDDDFPLEPPEGLSGTEQWFHIALMRTPSVWPSDDVSYGRSAGIELWFAPAPALMAFLDDPAWDTGNLLGYDCLGVAGPDARAWCERPAIIEIIDAFAPLTPAAVVCFDGDEKHRLV